MKPIEDSNEHLTILEKIAASDKNAAKELLNSYGNFVYSLAKNYTYTHEDAEDAVQDIFIELWKHAGRFDPQKSAEISFIALIAKRKLIDGYRKMKSRPQFDDSPTVFDNLTVKEENQFLLRLDLQKALKTLNKLQPEQKNLIIMSFYEGLSHSVIAEIVGKPLGTIKSNIRRGLQTIRQDLTFGNV